MTAISRQAGDPTSTIDPITSLDDGSFSTYIRESKVRSAYPKAAL